MKRISHTELAKNVLSLPRLPIPTLVSTADRYRGVVRALKPGAAADKHLEKLTAFLDTSGPSLQRRLVEGDAAAAAAGIYPFSYVEDLNTNLILKNRAPLEVNVNPGFVLQQGIAGTDDTQVGVAAGMAYAMAMWVREAVKEGVVCTNVATDLSPLAVDFGRSLIPGKDADEIRTTPLASLRHVIVLHDGHPYMVRLLNDHHEVVPYQTIRRAFETILKVTPDEDNTAAVSVLTAASRTLWGQAYQELVKVPENADVLRLFQESIIVICLDSKGWVETSGLAEASVLHGSTDEFENRWYDKHQLIVSADGVAAFNFEPTGSDRVHWARWIDDLLSLIATEKPATTASPTKEVAADELATVLRHLTITYGKNFSGHIRTARQEVSKLVKATEVTSWVMPFGAKELAAHNVDPCAFVQLCLQLASCRLRGRMTAASELCSLAQFYHGGSERAWSASVELYALAERLSALREDDQAAIAAATEAAAKAAAGSETPAVTPASPTDLSTNMREELAGLIRAAANKHVSLVRELRQGQGIDNHLRALHDIALANKDAAGLGFFEDELFRQASTFQLTTSEFSRPWLRYFTMGPDQVSGYGVGYVVKDDSIRISMTANINSPATDLADMKIAIDACAATLYHCLGGTSTK